MLQPCFLEFFHQNCLSCVPHENHVVPIGRHHHQSQNQSHWRGLEEETIQSRLQHRTFRHFEDQNVSCMRCLGLRMAVVVPTG